MSDLREQIANEVHHSKPTHNGCSGCNRTGDAVWTNAVGPVLDAKDAEIARLRLAWQSARQGRRSARLVSGEFQRIIRKQRRRAELAEKREAEITEDRDQMWAEVQKLRETVLALETQVGDLAAERNKYIGELRRQVDPVAALAQPGDQEGTP